jgi:hypothetical protein
LDFRDGSEEEPVKIGVSASFSRIDATTRAEVNTMGPEGTDGPDGATVIRASIKGVVGNQVQVVAGLFSAWQTSKYAGEGNDACPLYSFARSTGTGRAIGMYTEVRREGEESRGQQGWELRLQNDSGVDDTYSPGSFSKSMAIEVNAAGAHKAATVIEVGNAFAQNFDTGIAFHPGSITGASYRDDSESARGIFITKAHANGSIVVKAGAGAVILGREEPNAGTHLLELFAGEGVALDPIMKIGSGLTGTSTSVEWHNAAAQMKIWMSGGTNAFLTGTVNGDSGINFTPGKTFHVGAIGKSGMFRIGEAGLGVFGESPKGRTAAYTQTYATAARTHAEPELSTTISVTLVTELDTELNKTNKAVNELKKLINSVIDDHQLYGWFQ